MDIRVIRSKKAIREAFFELMVEKEMQEITLTEIANKANVNRQTLYNYYSGIHEILSDFVNDLFENYRKTIYQTDVINCFETPMIIFKKINYIIEENLDFYRKLFKMEHNLILKKIIGEKLFSVATEAFKKYHVFSSDKVEIISSYLVHGLMGTYQYYFNHETLDLKEYSHYVSELVFGGLTKQIEIKK